MRVTLKETNCELALSQRTVETIQSPPRQGQDSGNGERDSGQRRAGQDGFQITVAG